ncbi:MAG: hypothetical protein JWP97_6417 [Labilithrix sp.]|nr:hypothetical protein [Labilithrix sp.]
MMHRSRWRSPAGAVLAAAVTVATSLAPTRASADETPGTQAPRTDNRARAQQLFDSALADAEAGDFAAACPKFQASQDADPKPSTLLNLASCYDKNGQTASAWGAFREAEGLARKAGRADWEQAARTRAEALEPKLVRLTVQVPEPSRVPGLAVTRDGARLTPGEWGVAIPVDPGEHVIAASAPGRLPWEQRARLADSQSLTVPALDVAPVASSPAASAVVAPPASPPPSSWWTPLRTAGAISAGVGAAGLVTGAVLGLVAKSEYDDAKAQCSGGTAGCPRGALADSDSAYGLAAGATAVFVIGAVAAAGGVAVLVLAPPPRENAAVTASVRLGPGSLGVVGTW